MAQISATKCGICEENIGHFYCHECQCHLCKICKTVHGKIPATKNHYVDESHKIQSISSDKLACDKHTQEFVLFCQNCDRLTCSSCVATEHNGHSFTDVSKIASEARIAVRQNIDFLESKMKTLSELIEQTTSKRQDQVKKDSDRYKEEVGKISSDFKNFIESEVEMNNSRVSDYTILETQHLDFEVAKLEKSLKEYSSLHTQLEQVMLQRNDVAFFVHQIPLSQAFGEIEDIPCIQEPEPLGEMNKENFTENIIERIQTKYKIRALEMKNKQIQELSERLQQKEREVEQLKEDHRKAVEKISTGNERIQNLEESVKAKQDENKDLLNRLIEVMENIQYYPIQPLKLCEQFCCLYDNDWTDIYELLEATMHIHEAAIISILLNILKEINQACIHDVSEQLAAKGLNASSGSMKTVKVLLKTDAIKYIPVLKKKLFSEDSTCRTVCKYKDNCLEFMEKSVQICYYAAVQDPPVHLEFEPGKIIDKAVFRNYTMSGTKTDYLVWPAMFLNKGGRILCKGVVQPLKSK